MTTTSAPPSLDDQIYRMRAYVAYTGITAAAFANAAGVDRGRLAHFMTDEWNPRMATLSKVLAAVPPEFSVEAIEREYAESVDAIREWFEATGLRRYHLQALKISYDWVKDIDSEHWAPSWFAVRRLRSIMEEAKKGTTINGAR